MAEFGRVTGTVGLGRRTRWMLSIGVSAALVAFFAPGAAASSQHAATQKPTKQAPSGKIAASQIRTSSDKALKKLDPKLRKAFKKHDGASVAVFVSVVGDPRAVARKLHGAHTTKSGTLSLVVGKVPANQLVKIAADSKVLAVRQVTFRRDGTPVATTEHQRNPLSGAAKAKAVAQTQAADVPYSEAPPAAGVDSSRSSRSSTSWTPRPTTSHRPGSKGFTGKGIHRGRLRRRHRLVASRPDRREGREGRERLAGRVRPVRHPAVAGGPDQIDQGLSWYCAPRRRRARPTGELPGDFATKTGPSRNLANPPGTNEHTYTLPGSWSKSGNGPAGQPPRRLLARLLRRAPRVPGDRPQHGRCLRHDLRRPQ